MTYSITRYLARSAALAICLAPALVFAQQQTGAAVGADARLTHSADCA